MFAGQRLDGFYVDLGAIFDLGDLRPFQNLHIAPMAQLRPGSNATNGFGVHTIAIKVPKSDLTRQRPDADEPDEPRAVVGVWACGQPTHGR